MRLKILGRKWRLCWRNLSKKDPGECDWPTRKNRAIRIRKGMKPRAELETLIHECLHAGQWYQLPEEWVEQMGHDLARIIIRLGWRKK